MRFAALIVAAGRGVRAGGGLPKQYRPLGPLPMLRRTLDRFLAHPDLDLILAVTSPADATLYAATIAGLDDPRLLPTVAGGATRSASVQAGLEALGARGDAPPLVLIHDAARPFTPHAVIDGVLDALTRDPGAFPVLPVVDALWRGGEGLAEAGQSRAGLYRAQTPQGFHLTAIAEAYRTKGGTADDDVAIARAAGLSVAMTRGAEENFKITEPGDFARAAQLMEGAMDIRTGNGFDVHRFCEGNGVTLCGVVIPFDRGLDGHSDADVGMHAITDAIFGALAEGDIGQWFPPSDPQWKGAASHIFLAKAVERVAARSGRITHVDCTLICERPKVAPHAVEMRETLGAILGIGAERVSVKATTSERLGFTGRGEGIAAMATATVILP